MLKKIFIIFLFAFSILNATLNITASENISLSTPNFVLNAEPQNPYMLFPNLNLGLYKFSNIERAQENDEKQRLPLRITAYRPIYYIDAIKVNDNFPNAMVNISFKYRVVEDLDLFFGYTQLMFWDRNKESSPFKDINYNPELFYRFYIQNSWLTSIDLGLYEHKSNGLAGEFSRSWDRQYLQFNTEYEYLSWFNIPRKINWTLKYFKLWEGLLDDNRDIGKYIGNLSQRITIEDHFNFGALSATELYFEFNAGGNNKMDFSMGGIEIGYIFNCQFFGLNPRIYVQAFNGYGHSLLQYKEVEHAIRMGLIII